MLDRMLYLFFAFLFLMLMFSNMIIGYSTLFKSQETQWMLTLPVRSLDVFRWKLMETTLLASWAFLFLSAPLMAAYGNARHVSPSFYLKVFLLFVPFTVIPAALGSIAILIVTRYLHRRVFKWALFGVSVVGIATGVTFLKPMQAEQLEQAQMVASLTQLLHNSNMTVQPMLPSYWVASSMIAWGEGWSGKGLFYFLVLLSNAMMATLVCVTLSRRLFYEGWSRNHTQGEFQLGVPFLDKPINLPRADLADRVVSRWPRLHHATRALVIKDIRVFWRDTSQWSQFVIFFGLLGLYVLNLRSVAYDWSNQYWASFVCFLNLGASSMTLATLTTRFVFPQFSLEGKRLWIVGMVPNGLKRVLLEKFWLSSVCSAAITLCLMLTSSWMLCIPGLTVLFASTVIVMSFALCGIAVGIGALFPNFSSASAPTAATTTPPASSPALAVPSVSSSASSTSSSSSARRSSPCTCVSPKADSPTAANPGASSSPGSSSPSSASSPPPSPCPSPSKKSKPSKSDLNSIQLSPITPQLHTTFTSADLPHNQNNS